MHDVNRYNSILNANFALIILSEWPSSFSRKINKYKNIKASYKKERKNMENLLY